MVERVTVVELTYRGCSLSFGTSPCTATGGLSQACFNTSGSCRDRANFSPTDIVEYYVMADAASQNIPGLVGAKPFLLSVSELAAKMNFAGFDDSFDGFGLSGRLSVTFSDGKDSGLSTDPYRESRAVDYYNSGTYWGKWTKRHKYPKNIKLRVYEGEAGQTLAEMRSRLFFVSDVSDPTGGTFTITARDVMTYLDERAPMYPPESAGVLNSDISETDTALSVVSNSNDFAAYEASKLIRIGDEILSYTDGARVATTGVATFTGVSRGLWGTSAGAHTAGDSVQVCALFESQRPDDVVAEILDNTGLDPVYFDLSQWSDAVDFTFPNLLLTRVLSVPTNGRELISGIIKPILLNVYWDAYEEKIRFAPVDGYIDEPPMLTDIANVLPGLAFSTDAETQSNRIIFKYNYKNQTADEENYDVYDLIDVELLNVIGEERAIVLDATWMRQKPDVFEAVSKYTALFSEPIRRVSFAVDGKDANIGLGSVFRLSHVDEIDELGQPVVSDWVVTRVEPVRSGESIRIEAVDVSAFGKLWTWEDDLEPDYSGSGDPDASYWTDDLGEIADNVEGAYWG